MSLLWQSGHCFPLLMNMFVHTHSKKFPNIEKVERAHTAALTPNHSAHSPDLWIPQGHHHYSSTAPSPTSTDTLNPHLKH